MAAFQHHPFRVLCQKPQASYAGYQLGLMGEELLWQTVLGQFTRSPGAITGCDKVLVPSLHWLSGQAGAGVIAPSKVGTSNFMSLRSSSFPFSCLRVGSHCNVINSRDA